MIDRTDQPEPPRPKVKLVGRDGNAYAVLGACMRAARAAGWSEEALGVFLAQATSGGYDRLLATVQEYFEVE